MRQNEVTPVLAETHFQENNSYSVISNGCMVKEVACSNAILSKILKKFYSL